LIFPAFPQPVVFPCGGIPILNLFHSLSLSRAVPCRKGSLATGNPLIRKTYVSYDIMFRMFRRKPNPGIRIGIGVFGRSIGAESRRGIRFRSKEGALS
jgi:hypothetical protein